MVEQYKCAKCGSSMEESFMSSDISGLFVSKGKGLIKELFGKRKKVAAKMCNKCGFIELYGK